MQTDFPPRRIFWTFSGPLASLAKFVSFWVIRVTYLAKFMAVQMEVSSSPSEKIFNARRTLEAMW